MRPIQNAGGNVGLTGHEYPIAADTAIQRGEVVQLSGGYVVAAVAAQTNPILGIAAESHPGTADALNPRANGTRIRVFDNPGLIFESPAPRIGAAASNCGATAVAAASGDVAATIADDAFIGGLLQLVVKAAGSTNTDPVGKRKPVTDYAKTNLVFTVPSGGTAYAGDVYELYPPIGTKLCALDSLNFSKAVVSATGATAVKVVGHDPDRGMLRCMAALHALGTEE